MQGNTRLLREELRDFLVRQTQFLGERLALLDLLALVVGIDPVEDDHQLHGKSKSGKFGHGLRLGRTGVDFYNARHFAKLAPTGDIIMITACGAAAVDEKYSQDSDGQMMCSTFARYARATVIAAVRNRSNPRLGKRRASSTIGKAKC